MSKVDIENYRYAAEEMRAILEANYQHYMNEGDYISAHEIVKSMMAYQVIHRDDPRCKKGCKLFIGIDTKDPNNWGPLDYRRSDGYNFIPKYLFCELKTYTNFECPTLEHWGKRVEGNFEGDVKVPAGHRNIRMSLVNTQKTVTDAVIEMSNIFKNNGMDMGNIDEMVADAREGVVRVYKLEITDNTIHKYRVVGYVFTKFNSVAANMSVGTVIKHEALYNNWIDISKFMQNMKQGIYYCIENVGTIKNFIDNKKAHEIQALMQRKSMTMETESNKLRAEAEAEAKAKAEAHEIAKKKTTKKVKSA